MTIGKAKGCLYVRVSSEKQRDNYSLETQVARLTEFAFQKTVSLFDESGNIRLYTDVKSGKDDDRPGFKQMISDAIHGKINAIFCLSDDRFMRNTKQLLIYLDDLQAIGVYLHFYDLQHIDIYSPDGRAFLTMKATFSEQYRPVLSRKTSLGMQQKSKTGQWIGAAPYGYNILVFSTADTPPKLTNYLEINEQEQAIKERMRSWQKEGMTDSEIAEKLNSEHIPTKNPTRNDKLVKWDKLKIRRILKTDDSIYTPYVERGAIYTKQKSNTTF